VESFSRRSDFLDVGVIINILNVTDQIDIHYFEPFLTMIYYEQLFYAYIFV
jgi:hypothetical protein